MMKRWLIPALMVLALAAAAWGQATGFLPGQRVLMDAHNCYP